MSTDKMTLEEQVRALSERVQALEHALTSQYDESNYEDPPIHSAAWVAAAPTDEKRGERQKRRDQATRMYGYATHDNYVSMVARLANGYLSITLNGDVLSFYESIKRPDGRPDSGSWKRFSVKVVPTSDRD